ncbi:MAG TPA: MFS transporter [Bacteroidales bacterium]|nr:MFS transporter [Bacteroidales bacterium]HPS16743.1 MFS transporter [Bacteroidales bacterium]
MASEFNQQLNFTERRTYRLHLWYSIIEGIILGVLALNEFIFVRSIKGSNYQLSILFQLTTVLLIFAVFFHEILKRVENKRKMLRIVAIVTRLPLALLFFFPANPDVYLARPEYHYLFLIIFLFYYFANPIIYPSINQLLKNNYKHIHFGRLYSRATIWNKIIMMIVTFLYGYLLDYDYYSFRYVLPITAILGIYSVYLLTRIRFQKQPATNQNQKFSEAVKESVKGIFKILKENKPYQHFEIGFMLYGFAFMSTVSVITLFFSNQLELNYTSVAFYKNGYNILAIILLPLFGRLIGKIDPRRFAAITFFSIMMYLIFLVFTEYFPYYTWIADIKLYYFLIFYMVGQGLFAATMGLLWSIGSAYFCKNEDADAYQAIHLTLTGERALFAPILGILFYNLFGFAATFLIGAALLSAAIIVMLWSLKRDKKKSIV